MYFTIDRVVFVKSKFGNNMVRYGNYYYYYAKRKNDGIKKRWKCNKARRFGCKANVTTIEDQVVRVMINHNHN